MATVSMILSNLYARFQGNGII